MIRYLDLELYHVYYQHQRDIYLENKIFGLPYPLFCHREYVTPLFQVLWNTIQNNIINLMSKTDENHEIKV